LRDRIETWNFHLEDLKLKIHEEEAREGVATKEEDPRKEPLWS
jgi:hypothetical protein